MKQLDGDAAKTFAGSITDTRRNLIRGVKRNRALDKERM